MNRITFGPRVNPGPRLRFPVAAKKSISKLSSKLSFGGYLFLLWGGFLKTESDLKNIKEVRKKERNRIKVMKKILYKDISSDSEDYTMTANQIDNNNYVDSVVEPKSRSYIDFLINKYEVELNDYFYIDENNIDDMKTGGYIRYININEELKWGGILVNIKNKRKLTKMKLVLKNSTNNYWNIKYKNFYVFYKNNVSRYDKFRDLFISKAHLKF